MTIQIDGGFGERDLRERDLVVASDFAAALGFAVGLGLAGVAFNLAAVSFGFAANPLLRDELWFVRAVRAWLKSWLGVGCGRGRCRTSYPNGNQLLWDKEMLRIMEPYYLRAWPGRVPMLCVDTRSRRDAPWNVGTRPDWI